MKLKRFICIILAAAMLICLAACGKTDDNKRGGTDRKGSAKSGDLMTDVKAGTVNERAADDAFIASQMRLAVELFKKTAAEGKADGDNLLISPLSIQLALAMTANGAKGKTLDEMAKLLGGEFTLDTLNEYLHTYVASLPSTEMSKLEIANSVWFRDVETLDVLPGFLQKNADYFGAQAYTEPFNGDTANKINDWIDKRTDGMIKKVIDGIDPSVMLYLINAVCFNAEWEEIYEDISIMDREFTNVNGVKKKVEMMGSEEHNYICDDKAEGFIKYYAGRKYAFAALLPKEGVDVYDYIAGLTGEGLAETLKGANDDLVHAGLPKFKYDYETSLVETLRSLGMKDAFDQEKADLTGIGTSEDGNLYIGNVLHKTHIDVDERGTKAGAITVVEVLCGSALIENTHTVTLDRPFVYMLIDCSTNLPFFIGAVTDIGE